MFLSCSFKTYCLIGDGESAEGSIWEALHFASHDKLDNLVAIFDVNRLGQSAETSLGHDTETYRKRLEAFGCVSRAFAFVTILYVLSLPSALNLCSLLNEVFEVWRV